MNEDPKAREAARRAFEADPSAGRGLGGAKGGRNVDDGQHVSPAPTPNRKPDAENEHNREKSLPPPARSR